MALIDKLTAIGDAIREQTGETALLTLDAMAVTIKNINFSKITPINVVPDTISSFTYDGTVKTPEWHNYDSEQLSISGTTSATNAGIYTVYFTPKAGYSWADESVDSKSVTWSIVKANGSLSLSATSGKIIGKSNNTTTFTITKAGDGAISVQSSNTTIATVAISGTTVTVTSKGYGTSTITVSVAEGTNHTAPSNKTYSVTVDYLYLYNAGDENTSVTGGWQARAWRGSNAFSSSKAPTITKNSGTMAIGFTAGYPGVAETKKDINFKGFQKIYCRITKISGGSDVNSKARLSIVGRNETYYLTNSVANVTIESASTVSINISGLSSTTSYDVVIGGAGGASVYTVTVDKIWCE